MRIVAVLDLSKGIVVHAKRGERNKYAPIRSVLIDSTDPLVIASAFKERLGLNELYVADLDAITSSWADNNFIIVKKLCSLGLKVMIDCGINSLEKAKKALSLGVDSLIVGTETLTSLEKYEEIVGGVGARKIVFSLDLKDNGLLGEVSKEVRGDLIYLIASVQKIGVREIIILNLSRVGTETGASLKQVKAALRVSKCPILVGGGIKNIQEIKELASIGVKGVLIATAVHDGKITSKELQQLT